MAVLSAPSDIGIKDGVEVRVKMDAVKIYQGGAVGVVAGVGYATPLLVATSGMQFIGVALETLDNSDGSAGDKWIRVRRRGLIGFNNSSITVADIGGMTYFVAGSDDNTVSTTPSAVSAGILAAVDSNDVAWVSIDEAVAPDSVLAASIECSDITGTDASLGIAGLASAQGGAVALVGGTSSTAGNAGGAVTIVGGTPGVTGVGGAVTLTGGAGGATSGTGGAVAIAGGAGTNGNANGGAVTILAGNAHGGGTDGMLELGTSNTSAVTLAAASIPTVITGPLTRGIGASTAAAGSTAADAGALPAGTAGVYPTTAANDTAGVVINVADKVSGRMLFIGNGVKDKVLKVYPPSGGKINGNDADAAFSSASGKGVLIVCLNSVTNTWLAL